MSKATITSKVRRCMEPKQKIIFQEAHHRHYDADLYYLLPTSKWLLCPPKKQKNENKADWILSCSCRENQSMIAIALLFYYHYSDIITRHIVFAVPLHEATAFLSALTTDYKPLCTRRQNGLDSRYHLLDLLMPPLCLQTLVKSLATLLCLGANNSFKTCHSEGREW